MLEQRHHIFGRPHYNFEKSVLLLSSSGNKNPLRAEGDFLLFETMNGN
jgi:midasin (ATPase involved in ribosome maturation)